MASMYGQFRSERLEKTKRRFVFLEAADASAALNACTVTPCQPCGGTGDKGIMPAKHCTTGAHSQLWACSVIALPVACHFNTALNCDWKTIVAQQLFAWLRLKRHLVCTAPLVQISSCRRYTVHAVYPCNVTVIFATAWLLITFNAFTTAYKQATSLETKASEERFLK